jgi:putative transposase
LVEAPDITKLLAAIGRFHGRTSFDWNGDEQTRGRKVFYRCTERFMRSDRHFCATINYVHHNPVHHGYVQRWTDWQWSSAKEYLAQMGRAEAARIWNGHLIKAYGKKWDQADL